MSGLEIIRTALFQNVIDINRPFELRKAATRRVRNEEVSKRSGIERVD